MSGKKSLQEGREEGLDTPCTGNSKNYNADNRVFLVKQNSLQNRIRKRKLKDFSKINIQEFNKNLIEMLY